MYTYTTQPTFGKPVRPDICATNPAMGRHRGGHPAMRRVVFAAIPPVQIVDLTAPYEVFARAGGYRVELVSPDPRGLVDSSCGLTLSGATDYRDLKGPLDTLMVPGGDGAEEILCDRHFLAWLRSTGERARRVGSVCTGAFLLAAAGLLGGLRAVTHWHWCVRLPEH